METFCTYVLLKHIFLTEAQLFGAPGSLAPWQLPGLPMWTCHPWSQHNLNNTTEKYELQICATFYKKQFSDNEC